MNITLIRHGATKGNLEKRYVGRTNDPLTVTGRLELLAYQRKGIYPAVVCVYTSPLLRCRQTAQLLYPAQWAGVLPGIQETDFGLFEYKTYQQLVNTPEYQSWVANRGDKQYSQGEGFAETQQRCVQAFLQVANVPQQESTAIICHGGSIMAILSYFYKEYPIYHWQVDNGLGYTLTWNHKKQCITTTQALAKERFA